MYNKFYRAYEPIRAVPKLTKRTIMIYLFIETFHAIKLMSASGMSKEPQRKYFKL